MTARILRLPTVLELQGRIRLALSVLNHRGHSADTARLVERVLEGESIEEPSRDDRGTAG